MNSFRYERIYDESEPNRNGLSWFGVFINTRQIPVMVEGHQLAFFASNFREAAEMHREYIETGKTNTKN